MWCASEDMPKPTISRLRRGERFDGEDGRAFGERHAIAVPGKGTASRGRDDVDAVPRFEEHVRQWRLVRTGERGVHSARTHHLKREADCVGSRSTCGGDGKRGAGDAVLHADEARTCARHDARNGEGVNAAPARVELLGFLVFGRAAAGGAAEDDRDGIRGISSYKGGLLHGLARCGNRERRRALGNLALARSEPLLLLEILDRRRAREV